MRHYKYFIISILSLISTSIFSQENEMETEIHTYARYTENKGIELIILPENKHVLNLGITTGFIIERADFGNSNFIEIATTKGIPETEWDALIEKETDSVAKKQLGMVQFFYESLNETSDSKINSITGVSELRKQKSNQDLTNMVLLLSALKNAKVANALGLSYIDNSVEKGKMYQYRTRLKTAPEIYKVLSPTFKIEAVQKRVDYKNYFYVNQGDSQLGFYWKEIPTMHGYDIERSDNGFSNFKKLNNAPIYNLNGNDVSASGYLDKNLENYKKYTYNFYAYSVFGERVHLFKMTTNSIDLTPPPNPKLNKPIHKSEHEVQLNWEITPTADLKGFAVARSENNKGKFDILHSKLLSKNTKEFIDTEFKKGKQNYYIVQAIDTANNVSSSIPFAVTLIDSIPPAKPTINTAKIDSFGNVQITISLNKEKDLMGYRLFRANSDTHEFSAIAEAFIDLDSTNTTVQTIFKDSVTINSLTPNIYYRVKALDFNYNQSDFSDVSIVKRPDSIAPSSPVFKNVKVFENKVELDFSLSQSKDVKTHFMYRKTDINGNWNQLYELEKEQTTYIDTTVEKGKTYYYSLRAMDNSNLYSEYAISVYANPFDKGLRPNISNFTVSTKDKEVILNWEYTKELKNVYFVIFKKDLKGKLKQFKQTVEPSYIDTSPKEGTVSYAVKAFTKDGGQSKLSEIIDIKIE